MYKITITTKDNKNIAIEKVDSGYYSDEDNEWRFFNDLNDMKITGDYNIDGITLDGDTLFVNMSVISYISFN